MEWRKIVLTRDEVRHGELHKIIKLFYDILEAYKDRRPTKGIAIFESLENDRHFIFFSPASAKIPAITDLINIYSGLFCKTPFRGTINYLAGDVDFARNFL
jgi:hypothetical protein